MANQVTRSRGNPAILSEEKTCQNEIDVFEMTRHEYYSIFWQMQWCIRLLTNKCTWYPSDMLSYEMAAVIISQEVKAKLSRPSRVTLSGKKDEQLFSTFSSYFEQMTGGKHISRCTLQFPYIFLLTDRLLECKMPQNDHWSHMFSTICERVFHNKMATIELSIFLAELMTKMCIIIGDLWSKNASHLKDKLVYFTRDYSKRHET